MIDLLHIPFRSDGAAGPRSVFNVVIEAPRGSCVKLKYEPKLRTFVFSRALLLGTSYPYDWGFFPSTRADDGDPLDAIVLHEGHTWPGTVIPVLPVGVVQVIQKEGKNEPTRNDRVVVVPRGDERYAHVRELPRRVVRELEEFFVAVSRLTDKHLVVRGWKGPRAAARTITQAHRAFSR